MPQLRRNSITYNRATKTFTQVPPPEKPKRLTEEDKAMLIKEFKEIFKREPDIEELEQLILEERRIRKGIKREP